MAEVTQMATTRPWRRLRDAAKRRTPDRPPLGPSGEPSLRDVAVYALWLTGIALIVASLFL